MLASLRELHGARELLWMWALRSVKARYQQTVLGVAWAILQPLAVTAIYAVVFSVFIEVDTGGVPYPLFAYAGLLPWTLFAGAVTMGVPSLVQNMDLVTKIYFPREILPIAALGIPLVDFAAGAGVLVLFVIGYGASVAPTVLLIPVVLLVQLLFTLGVVLIGSAANVLVRDIGHVVPPALLVWQFATPIVYPIELVPERLRPFYLLNPMATLVDAYKRTLLQGAPPRWGYLGFVAVVSIALVVVGYVFFKRAERVFADVI